MVKFVSYALWGKAKRYNEGMVANVRLVHDLYPGYGLLVAVSLDDPPEDYVLNILRGAGAQIMPCGGDPVKFGLAWRIEQALNLRVQPARVMFRDADSRPDKREQGAVKDWESSGCALHIMRDHRRHTAPIMGGMWGVVLPEGLPSDISAKYQDWVRQLVTGKVLLPDDWKQSAGKFGVYSDQIFLRCAVWPWAVENTDKVLMHDDSSRYGDQIPAVKFSVRKQPGHFVGQQYDDNGKALCPK